MKGHHMCRLPGHAEHRLTMDDCRSFVRDYDRNTLTRRWAMKKNAP